VAALPGPRSDVIFGRFDPALLPELMRWFPDADELRVWGGPEFRFPFTAESFREDSRVDTIDSFALVRNDGVLAAFGQCYLRVERCHFGRLGVSPHERGRGLGTRLIRELAAWGRTQFGPRELSLFVLRDNMRAYRLYHRLGYRDSPYPEPALPVADTIYMVATRLHDAADAN
jgi:ribosomal protein S18 acetylase RimI-like enzyme